MRVEELVKKLDNSISITRNLSGGPRKNEKKFENRIPFPDD
jgi:hypothetical protein